MTTARNFAKCFFDIDEDQFSLGCKQELYHTMYEYGKKLAREAPPKDFFLFAQLMKSINQGAWYPINHPHDTQFFFEESQYKGVPPVDYRRVGQFLELVVSNPMHIEIALKQTYLMGYQQIQYLLQSLGKERAMIAAQAIKHLYVGFTAGNNCEPISLKKVLIKKKKK